MNFLVNEIVSYISQFMSLPPGDIISTRRSPGVGLGQKPKPISLNVGQTIRLSIEGLRKQEQSTVSHI